MSQSIPEKLDVNRTYKQVLGLKADKTVHRVTFAPSTANPGETLRVSVPRLSQNVVMVPGSFGLLFTLKLASVDSAKTDANRLVVNNLGRNLVVRKKVSYGGEEISNTDRSDLFQTYSDLFAMKMERGNMMREGVSEEDMRKLRTDAGDKSTDAKKMKLAGVYGKRYRIPLCHPIIDSHGASYPREMSNALTFEITLPESTGITVHDTAGNLYDYSLSNMELEYECVSSDYLAREASLSYQVGKEFYYEDVLRQKTFNFDDKSDTMINEHINIPRRSMTGILLLFTKAFTAGKRDSEKFVNPDITKVDVNIDGMPNKLYSKGMIPSDFWAAIVDRMGLTDNITQEQFYVDKFALWIDLRTYPDDSIHGNGLMLNDTKDGVKIEIRRSSTGAAGDTTTCHMLVVSDAMVTFKDNGLLSILR